MKKKVIFPGFLVLAVFTVLNFYKPQTEAFFPPDPPPGNPTQTGFLYGAIHTIDDGPNYSNYDQLGLGFWHTYVAGEYGQIPDRQTPRGPWNSFWPQNDQLMTPVAEYSAALTAIIDQIYQHNQSKILWQRPKIEWLAYGQRSDYQCEEIVGTTNPLWFYSFQSPNHAGTDIPDQGATVRYCQTGTGAGLVVSKLKANTEQSKTAGTADVTNLWQFDHQCNWFVKPRIRILPSFIPGHEESDVCTIYIKKQDGTDKISPVTIKAKHFKQFNGPQYTGDYIEEFYFAQTEYEIPKGIPFPGGKISCKQLHGAGQME